ncbi:MAG TPA: monovalent cation/H+ antiporter subunit D, partial [Pseudomonas sp.]|nr:monovalent cation/H+ antiporter subunit D [Pseudomonas sp.]
MSHLPILPVLVPMFAGALLLVLGASMDTKRALSLLATFLQIPLAAMLVVEAGQGIGVYDLGNWMPPFGIVLVVDRLSALLLLVTAILAAAAIIYAVRGDDAAGRNFHPLFQFQLMGINGAFLTGDLFNLFVFFEVLLISSYALLLHGAGSARVRSGLHYLLLNLTGSALFLIAVGTLYGVTGTLNMADMALRVRELDPADAPLVGAAGMLLLVVFGLKTAVFPLYFWLPRAYAAAGAPVAALFAIMTKVGLYSILR